MKEILEIWSEISYEPNVKFNDHFRFMSLWHNSFIRIDRKGGVQMYSNSCKLDDRLLKKGIFSLFLNSKNVLMWIPTFVFSRAYIGD